MQHLKANTEVIVTIGPFVDVADGFTPQTDITLGGDEAELLKHGSDTVVDISAATWAAVANCRGYYSLTLTAALTDTEGMVTIVVQDDSDCLPVRANFMVLAEAAWDSLYAAKDTGLMDVNVSTVAGTAQTANDNGADINAILVDTDDLQTNQGAWLTATGFSTAVELAKVPKSDGTATWNATALASIEAECDDAITANTLILDLPTTAEFEARTLVSADYVVTTDTIAGVTLVDTVTDVTNEVTADVTKISGSAAAANNLEASALTILSTYTAVTGTLSTTQMTTDLTEVTDDHYNGRIIIWTSGVLQNQATNITDYDGASKMLTFTATTEAPSNLDTFVIV